MGNNPLSPPGARRGRQGLLFALYCLFALPAVADQDYPPQIKPIVEQRCMVCHGCYDAPCQLKLDAFIGLERGASKKKVYDGTRLDTAELTRLFEDAHTVEAWRNKGFYPVLREEEPDKGILRNLLVLKQRNPLPPGRTLPSSFDFGLDRDQNCPRADQLGEFVRRHPLWGMPYGFPGLDEQQHRQMITWLEAGANGVHVPPRPADERDAVARWEQFFNGTSLKQQLMARYIYEHLFIGNLYFDELGQPSVYYKMVRSSTPPGQPIKVIASRRPYDDPGGDPFWYRLQSRQTAVLDKRHMPYVLNDARMQRWQTLFIDADYTVEKLPGYELSVAANPFVSFRALPVNTRYRFMLEEAQFTIMGFIKGPVCRGQVALNVIDDHFWVAFIAPSAMDSAQTAGYLADQSANLRLPEGSNGLLVTLATWHNYAKRQQELLKAKAAYISKRVDQGEIKKNLGVIWDGDGHNTNAALTIFRHNDSASVVKGFVGREPKTAWIIDYSLLERIHYLLVAGFDVFGNVGHQLESRLYMDFLRMEGEQNFLEFLPEDLRLKLRDYWYRGARDDVKNYVLSPENARYERKTAIHFNSDDPKQEFLDMLRARLPGAISKRYDNRNPKLIPLLRGENKAFSLMPEVTFLDVIDSQGKDHAYTLLRNSAHSNNAQIFAEEDRRLPAEDTLTVVEGFIGSYPNIFMQVLDRDLEQFVTALTNLETEADYAKLLDDYGVRRNASWFWRLSDGLHELYKQQQPVEAGLFDLNRYENR